MTLLHGNAAASTARHVSVNIASYHQARRSPQAAGAPTDALAAINVDPALTNGVLDKLQALPDVVEVRLANFGD